MPKDVKIPVHISKDAPSDEGSSVPPGIAPGEDPAFHKIGPTVFQKLSRDIFDKEPGIEGCEIFGVSGQAQFGIDLKAFRTDRLGIEVGQCKAYEEISARQIREASDDFFKHWESRWSKENVRRFVLIVACDMSTTQQADEIEKQRQRFADNKIGYEAWSSAKIKNKLRPHPGIVAEYLTPADHWLKVICGQGSGSFGPRPEIKVESPNIYTAMSNQLDQLAEELTDETEQRLIEMRQLFREGKKRQVIAWLKEIQNNKNRWPFFSNPLKSILLRFEATLSLDLDDGVSQAKKLADEAKALSPDDDESRIRALIAHYEGNQDHALSLVANPKDVDSRNLRAALLFFSGRFDEALATLELPADQLNAESLRLRALSSLFKRDVGRAILEIEKALEAEPRWEAIRSAAAMIYYYSALSPAAIPSRALPWPEPVEWNLVRRDNESLKTLGKATGLFASMLSVAENKGPAREQLSVWHFACLAINPESQEVAIEYCRKTLDQFPANLGLIAWVVVKNLGIDLQKSISELSAIRASEPKSIQLLFHWRVVWFTAESRKMRSFYWKKQRVNSHSKVFPKGGHLGTDRRLWAPIAVKRLYQFFKSFEKGLGWTRFTLWPFRPLRGRVIHGTYLPNIFKVAFATLEMRATCLKFVRSNRQLATGSL